MGRRITKSGDQPGDDASGNGRRDQGGGGGGKDTPQSSTKNGDRRRLEGPNPRPPTPPRFVALRERLQRVARRWTETALSSEESLPAAAAADTSHQQSSTVVTYSSSESAGCAMECDGGDAATDAGAGEPSFVTGRRRAARTLVEQISSGELTMTRYVGLYSFADVGGQTQQEVHTTVFETGATHDCSIVELASASVEVTPGIAGDVSVVQVYAGPARPPSTPQWPAELPPMTIIAEAVTHGLAAQRQVVSDVTDESEQPTVEPLNQQEPRTLVSPLPRPFIVEYYQTEPADGCFHQSADVEKICVQVSDLDWGGGYSKADPPEGAGYHVEGPGYYADGVGQDQQDWRYGVNQFTQWRDSSQIPPEPSDEPAHFYDPMTSHSSHVSPATVTEIPLSEHSQCSRNFNETPLGGPSSAYEPQHRRFLHPSQSNPPAGTVSGCYTTLPQPSSSFYRMPGLGRSPAYVPQNRRSHQVCDDAPPSPSVSEPPTTVLETSGSFNQTPIPAYEHRSGSFSHVSEATVSEYPQPSTSYSETPRPAYLQQNRWCPHMSATMPPPAAMSHHPQPSTSFSETPTPAYQQQNRWCPHMSVAMPPPAAMSHHPQPSTSFSVPPCPQQNRWFRHGVPTRPRRGRGYPPRASRGRNLGPGLCGPCPLLPPSWPPASGRPLLGVHGGAKTAKGARKAAADRSRPAEEGAVVTTRWFQKRGARPWLEEASGGEDAAVGRMRGGARGGRGLRGDIHRPWTTQGREPPQTHDDDEA